MTIKSIRLPVAMFFLTLLTLIINTSSTLMTPPIDHQHIRHLQQASTPAGNQINPSSSILAIQPLTGINPSLVSDRNLAGSKSSKLVE